tara:strand:- start:126 stop:2180 length:2055 start_codon:yes stop_codon:yes gene_type:complete
VIFVNPISNYAVLMLKETAGEQVVTGPLADCHVGDFISVKGEWVSHPVHKQQFKVLSYQHLIPRTTEDLLLFLSSGVISGIGPHFASTLVNTFGEKLISILDESPNQLLTVSGIGQKKLDSIVSSWHSHREQLSFLQWMLSQAIDIKLAKRIWNHYYAKAFDVCRDAPYDLIHAISGLTFKVADQIAGNSHASSEARIDAAIFDVFHSYYSSANVWMLFSAFKAQLNARLSYDDDVLLEALQQRVFSQTLTVVIDGDEKWVTMPELSNCELTIMNGIDALIQAPMRISIQAKRAVEWIIPRSNPAPSPDQVQALEGLCEHPVSILHGGPGTGKTSLLKAYVAIVSKKTDRILCLAPTGKAAKRLAEQVGRRAATIHSMMDYDEKSHALTPKPLDCDICIVDEMSMVDMQLFFDVLQMVPLGVRLVLVGDPDQLPSIGPGQVFSDMIQFSSIPTFKLTTNHRQQTHRGITSLAQHILTRSKLTHPLGDDCTFIHTANDDELDMKLMSLYIHDITKHHQVTIHDVQMIVPIHKGRFGIRNLNQEIANHIRSQGHFGQSWVVGDRVIQCRNNYTKRVMNGDIGFIESIESDKIQIRFHSDLVDFDSTDMQDIQLAYAVSIHKFQGSEAPIIIMPIVKQWGFFMSKDVLYTAVTRAKDHLYVVGDLQVFERMIQESKTNIRHTRLFQV